MKTSAFIKRHRNNPVLSAKNVPYNDALVFNAGVTKFKGRYVMIFRNDFGSLKDKKLTGVVCLGIAFSDDGIEWNVEKERLIKDTDSLLY
ncbi:MAG: glycosidase, partial [Lentisphaerota bacterium]